VSGQPFPAFRFDGRRAEAAPVCVSLDEGTLVVEAADGRVLERESLARVAVSDRLDHAPRLLWLPGGVTLEVVDADRSFDRALHRAGLRAGPAVRMQQWWPGVILGLALLVSLLIVGYFHGLPVAARWAAFAMPGHLEDRIGERILAVLDTQQLRPTRLDPQRREAIAQAFSTAASAVAAGVEHRLEFRSSHKFTINALTLPGGIIVLFDGLVGFVDDAQLLAVLGHELGHVVHKHSMRQLFQTAGTGALAGLLWGDFSGTAASIPVVLGLLRYSREAEREADDFAVAFLRSQGRSARPLYEFLARMSARRPLSQASIMPNFMSTHPSTEERMQRLRDAGR
jgi:Zn-dependent protease with chaperone function